MIRLLLGAVLFVAAIVVLKKFGKKTLPAKYEGDETGPNPNRGFAVAGTVVLVVLGIVSVVSTSFTTVSDGYTGHLIKVFGFTSLEPGNIIAIQGEKGRQAELLPPGFHFRWLLNIIYKVEQKRDIIIRENHCGTILVMDGEPLKEGEIYAREWPDAEGESKKMLVAEYFLTHGGQKGPQISVLKPGQYKINQYLFQVDVNEKITTIEKGFVGVVKSHAQQVPYVQADVDKLNEGKEANLAAPVVPKGYKGIWVEPLAPAQYYLNTDVFDVEAIDTRVQTWRHIGGYTRRSIDLTVGLEGKIQQKESSSPFPVPSDAVDMAVITRVEGWKIYQDLRVLVQVIPEIAPYVVASVGGIQQVEEKVLTPAIRSVVRNVTGEPGVKVLDLIEKRDILESAVEAKIIPEATKAYVTIKEVRFGDPAIPPELLVAKLRQQLAVQLQATFEQEKIAQQKRIEVEKARAQADQQPTLIEAQIKDSAADFLKSAMQKQGEGEKLRLMEVAEGQKAQVAVLGEDKVMLLAMLKNILEKAVENPNIVKVPVISVTGGGTGLEGAAAILGGASNMSKMNSASKALAPSTPATRSRRTTD